MTVLAVLAALVMIAVSTAMNFHFMRSLAQTETEGLMLGGASAAADIFKAVLPLFIAIAWRGARYLYAVMGSIVFVVFSLFSFASALGFAADARGVLAGSREAVNDQLLRALSDENAKRNERKKLGVQRREGVIASDLARLSQDRRYTSSKACIEATVPMSRDFCVEVMTVRGELEQARVVAKLDTELALLSDRISALRLRGAGGEVDPQVSVSARVLAQDRGVVKNVLVVFAAVLVELGSGFGLWLALGHSAREHGADRAWIEAKTPVPSGAAPAVVRASIPSDAVPTAESLLGDVVDFMVERVFPTTRGGLTLFALYRDYRSWCDARGRTACAEVEFANEFAAVANETGIVLDSDRYVGIRTGDALL